MNLFRGEFNWQGEIHRLYTYATSYNKAFYNFTVRLSKILDFSRQKIVAYFNMDKRPKFKIILLKKKINVDTVGRSNIA